MYTISNTINIHKKYALDMKRIYNPQKKMATNLWRFGIELEEES